MRRAFFPLFSLSLVIAGACSLLNAPDEIRPGGGGPCTVSTDCPASPLTMPCHVPVCGANHLCSFELARDGSRCDDGEPCTTGETCAKGECVNGTPTDCSMLDSDCFKGTCTKGVGCGMVAVSEGIACDTQNLCADSRCQGGQCMLVAPKNIGGNCDDGTSCVQGKICDDKGKCTGGTPIGDGQPCDDKNGCTSGETCSAALCSGGTPTQAFFSDDFSSSSKGWVLGKEWQIGPAKTSSGEETGGPDPATDHTETDDNGLAGVVIGGNASITPHAAAFLESPAIDTSMATGKIFLTYYRWLNSDSAPYMVNTVEVNDGTTWHPVFKSDDVVEDPVWTFQSHDVTQFKGSTMKVRFGLQVGGDVMNDPAFASSSWNIDDVKLQTAPCDQ